MRALTNIVFGVLMMAPGLAVAQGPEVVPVPDANYLPPSLYGEAKPAKFPSSGRPNAHLGDLTVVPRTFKNPMFEATHVRHINAPDGCPSPLGCGTAYTEFKFVFGSCRQFFGTGGSAPGTVFTPYNQGYRQP
jgi:hypothetical protein